MARAIPIALSLAIVFAAPMPARAGLALPTDFVDDLIVEGLNQPVGMAFLPDGRLLFVERTTGNVRLIVNGALAVTDPVGTVQGVNTAGIERGLLGIAVDPGWPARPYIYVHYNYVNYGPVVTADIRISRFTMSGDLSFSGNGSLTLDPLSRYDVLTDIPDQSYEHNGGTLRFGPQGYLYASIGDDGDACQAQSLNVLAGKILRLRTSTLGPGGGGPPPKGLITPPDNPFATAADSNTRLVLQWGLRNPFRFGIDRVTGNLVIGDVGEGIMEEIDYAVSPGANFEWPFYEGGLPGPTSCSGVDSRRFQGPVYTYDHSEGLAVNGGLVYRRPGSALHPFPPEYEGDILFCDFYGPWVRRLKESSGTWDVAQANGQPNFTDWAVGDGWISDWLEAPDGSVWYCQMVSGDGSGPGSFHRIRYTGVVSVPEPAASALEFRAPYPAPSNGAVQFDYSLASRTVVGLEVYDVAGRHVARVVELQARDAGPHRATWTARDDQGREMAPGIYVAVLSAGGHRIERRFALVR